MRVNVYAEEMTDRVEIISKEIDGHTFTGLRFYLYLPVTHTSHPVPSNPHRQVREEGKARQIRGPFIHRPGDDDSAAVTFWGKRDLRTLLRRALEELDDHYYIQARAHGFDDADGYLKAAEEESDGA